MWANAQRDGMAALPNIGGVLCSTPENAKPVEICSGAPNSPTDLSRWAEVNHIVATCGGDIAV